MIFLNKNLLHSTITYTFFKNFISIFVSKYNHLYHLLQPITFLIKFNQLEF